jgi:hypothetical protein
MAAAFAAVAIGACRFVGRAGHPARRVALE